MTKQREHATTGTCWCGYICGRLPVKEPPRTDYGKRGQR